MVAFEILYQLVVLDFLLKQVIFLLELVNRKKSDIFLELA